MWLGCPSVEKANYVYFKVRKETHTVAMGRNVTFPWFEKQWYAGLLSTQHCHDCLK